MKKILPIIGFLMFSTMASAQPEDIFISEYLEGFGYDKAIEIFNPTDGDIDLSNYKLVRYSNGSGIATEDFTFAGTLESGGTYVIISGNFDQDPPFDGEPHPMLVAIADTIGNLYPDPMYFNGDDALTIETIAGQPIDIFGKIGEDPGGAWTADESAGFTDANGATWWTANHTMIRKPSVSEGVTANPALFNPTLEWDTLGADSTNWGDLKSHTCDCLIDGIEEQRKAKDKVFVYPNPSANGEEMTLIASGMIWSIEIYDLTGKKVWKEAPEQQGTMHRLAVDLNRGLYLLRVSLENKVMLTKKLTIE